MRLLTMLNQCLERAILIRLLAMARVLKKRKVVVQGHHTDKNQQEVQQYHCRCILSTLQQD
ncbi:hypothetical protein Y5S_00775 [Alcanivorax nanhaiticus]|uniref:Uncharacterized protein n=1 Tax=Alcanivorax nanhaiticus TaxID=1177154 RepID=A0A095TV96_9GAMM|nr:hypothetical protein Y5S_00775 [Alcanivorax nanhaiticus]